MESNNAEQNRKKTNILKSKRWIKYKTEKANKSKQMSPNNNNKKKINKI